MSDLPATRAYTRIRDKHPAPSGGVARADLFIADVAVDELLARIAELEDQLSDITIERLRKKQIELAENGGCPCCLAGDEEGHNPGCELEQALAERDARRDMRCEKCAKWAGADDKFHGCPVEYDRGADNTDGDPPDDFYCNRYAERSTS